MWRTELSANRPCRQTLEVEFVGPYSAERASFEMFAEAFNLFNRTNGLTVNNTAFNFLAPTLESSPTVGLCPKRSTEIAAGIPNFNGCLQQAAPFLSVRTTANLLYTARQLQIGGRFRF